MERADLQKITDFIWEIPIRQLADGIKMRVPARVFASEKLLGDLFKDESLDQLMNVATLPGIQNWALSMPDIHEGYGFPIGGVAAFDANDGIISPGGIGYDINCGVRLIRSLHHHNEIKNKISELATRIYNEVPSGVGRGGQFRLVNKELDAILSGGVEKMVELGYAIEEDRRHCEADGKLDDANPDLISKIAKDRGRDQLGTIGAGNHFVEIQRVDRIFHEEAAKALGLFSGQVVIMVHCGSRGLGHQNATDYIQLMARKMPDYGIKISDSELACAPFKSLEGQNYWAAMSSCANFAWANRQLITCEIRRAWAAVFGITVEKATDELRLIYDVSHNIAKLEHYFDKQMLIHRKGATRSFPAGHPETPDPYKKVGQPVLIPGSMGTASYVLVGAPLAMKLSFGSSCHGAGRMMSRTKAKKIIKGSALKQGLENEGITVRSGSMSGLAEEAPVAYKDVEAVVDAVQGAGLANKVVRLKPIGVIKG